MNNNYMVSSLKFRPRPEIDQLNKTEMKPPSSSGEHGRMIHTEKKNGSVSSQQEYSFTYIKPSMIASMGPNNSTSRSSRPIESPHSIRWSADPNALDLRYSGLTERHFRKWLLLIFLKHIFSILKDCLAEKTVKNSQSINLITDQF